MSAYSAESPTMLLFTNVQVDSQGILLSQITAPSDSAVTLPQVRLTDAPIFGQTVILSRADVARLLQQTGSGLFLTNWVGAERARIIRRTRALKEEEIRERLTTFLQQEQVKGKGELELRFTRPWTTVLIPDEPFTLRILDLPTSGLSSSLVLRFELSTGKETIGSWQIPTTARIWREIWVARSTLRRNQLFSEADVVQERRDLLALRDAVLSLSEPETAIEIAENIPAGGPIYARSVRLRPVVRRGQVVDAQLQEGIMVISLKVEVLENGAPGQVVRVRNQQSKREFRGKVQNEQTILIPL